MRQLLFFMLLWVSFMSQWTFVLAQPQSDSIDSLKMMLKQSRPDTSRVNLLLELTRHYILKPGEEFTDLDTAFQFARQGYSLSRSLKYPKGEGLAYLLGGMMYREKGNTQHARKFDQKAVRIFSQHHNRAQLAAAYMELGNTYGNEQKDLQQKIMYYELALPLFQQTGLKEREATTLRELGDYYQVAGDYPKAIDLLKRALSIYRQINYPRLQGVYNLLGDVYSYTGNHSLGIKYGLLALRTAEEVRDTTIQLCTIHNRLGIAYFNIKEYRQAIPHFQKALNVARQFNDMDAIALTGVNLASSYLLTSQYNKSIALSKNILVNFPSISLPQKALLLNILIKTYTYTDRIDLAQQNCNQLLKLLPQVEKLINEQSIATILYKTVFNVYIKTNQFDQANIFLTRYEEQTKRYKIVSQLPDIYLMRFRLDSAQADYLSAINYYTIYKAKQDSIFGENKSKEIARLHIEFQTEQREHQLRIKEANIHLLRKENQVQQSRLQQQQNQRNSLIGGTALLLALLGLIYNRYRLKQGNIRELEAQKNIINQKNQSLQEVLHEKEHLLKEREWMLKEIHHRVKNNLQVISSMLNAQFDFLQDPTALAAIRDSQNRVQVMALIHKKLYQSENLALINMQEYIQEIVDYLIEGFEKEYTVRPTCNLAPLLLDVSLATPLGLIINEALTNSLKHAFPQNRPGTISVDLIHVKDQLYQLTLQDDGVGMPLEFDLEHSKALGLTMIRGLSKQIKGQLWISHNKGVEIRLQFNAVKKTTSKMI